jgi:hypothetical protein
LRSNYEGGHVDLKNGNNQRLQKLYNEELCNCFCLPNIPRVNKPRRMMSGAGYLDAWPNE